MKSLRTKTRGFTLIELLVVVAIIALLSSVVLAALTSARLKGRDARREADLRQVRYALELYANEHGGNYPTAGAWIGDCSGFGSHPQTGANGYVPNLAPQYISVLPIDPLVSASNCYTYRGSGYEYKIRANCESFTAATDPIQDPAQAASCVMAFYSPTTNAPTW